MESDPLCLNEEHSSVRVGLESGVFEDRRLSRFGGFRVSSQIGVSVA